MARIAEAVELNRKKKKNQLTIYRLDTIADRSNSFTSIIAKNCRADEKRTPQRENYTETDRNF